MGIPLYTDSLTEKQKWLGFEGSKVCVEIEANSPLPMTISVELRKDVYLEVKVVYPWKPQSCVNCKILGHSVSFMPVKE